MSKETETYQPSQIRDNKDLLYLIIRIAIEAKIAHISRSKH